MYRRSTMPSPSSSTASPRAARRRPGETRPGPRRPVLGGAVALLIVLGALLLAAPAQAVETCDTAGAGTQAYAECVTRGGDRDAAPVLPPTQREQTPAPVPVVEESATELWQLAGAGLIGAGIAVGASVAVTRLGQRQRVPAH